MPIHDHAVNFLRFSDRQWKPYQSRMLYQNRLRHSDYRRIFEELDRGRGSKMVLEDEIRAVRQMPLAIRFAGTSWRTSPHDTGATSCASLGETRHYASDATTIIVIGHTNSSACGANPVLSCS